MKLIIPSHSDTSPLEAMLLNSNACELLCATATGVGWIELYELR